MVQTSTRDLAIIFERAENASSAIRSIVQHYRVSEGESESNTYIVDKTVLHFRSHNKPDGVYRLGHGLELVLGNKSGIREEIPF